MRSSTNRALCKRKSRNAWLQKSRQQKPSDCGFRKKRQRPKNSGRRRRLHGAPRKWSVYAKRLSWQQSVNVRRPRLLRKKQPGTKLRLRLPSRQRKHAKRLCRNSWRTTSSKISISEGGHSRKQPMLYMRRQKETTWKWSRCWSKKVQTWNKPIRVNKLHCKGPSKRIKKDPIKKLSTC